MKISGIQDSRRKSPCFPGQESGSKGPSLRMPRIRSLLFLGAATLSASCFSVAEPGIPERIGDWRVEVGSAGNTFYEAPVPTAPASDFPPPSALVMRWVELIAPGASIEGVEMRNGNYRIRTVSDTGSSRDSYRFEVSPEGELGRLEKLEYWSDGRRVEEKPGRLIIRGTRKGIPLTDLPASTLATLAAALPRAGRQEAWRAETIAGTRYVIVVNDLVIYARPDGRIQAAGRRREGALGEIDPPEMYNLTGKETYPEELEVLLKPFQSRFNVENQIEKLGTRPASADGSYRYIVMGDSRSQYDLWSSILTHLDELDPKPDFIIITGDLVLRGTAREYRDYLIPPLLKTDIPFFVALGNHDTGWDGSAREYRFLFGDNALNYYFDYGKARFLFFDNVTRVQPFDETLEWIGKTLAETPAGFRKYVAGHKPPATIEKWAYHAMTDEDSLAFTDLMSEHKVDEVYLGHIHAYSTATLGGVAYTLSGGGGAGLHNHYGTMGNVHHYIICDVEPDGTVKQRIVRFFHEDPKEVAPKAAGAVY